MTDHYDADVAATELLARGGGRMNEQMYGDHEEGSGMTEITPGKLRPFSEMTMAEYCAELRRRGYTLHLSDDDVLCWVVNVVGHCGAQQHHDESAEAFHCRVLRQARKSDRVYDAGQEVSA